VFLIFNQKDSYEKRRLHEMKTKTSTNPGSKKELVYLQHGIKKAGLAL